MFDSGMLTISVTFFCLATQETFKPNREMPKQIIILLYALSLVTFMNSFR